MARKNSNSSIVEYSKNGKTWYRRFDTTEEASRAAAIARDNIGYAWQVDIDHYDVAAAYRSYKEFDKFADDLTTDMTMTDEEFDKVLDLVCNDRDRCASMLAAFAGIDEDTACEMILFRSDEIERVLGIAS